MQFFCLNHLARVLLEGHRSISHESQQFAVQRQRLAHGFPLDDVEILVDAFERAELDEQLLGGLRSDVRDAGDVVRGVADECQEIAELERRMRVNDMIIRYITVRVDEDRKKADKMRTKREKRQSQRAKFRPTEDAAEMTSEAAV